MADVISAGVVSRNKIFGVMNMVVGLLLVGLGIPLMMEKISPNGWYGFRTGKTLESAHNWYTANRHAGYALVMGGLVMAISGIIMATKRNQLNSKQSVIFQLGGVGGGLLVVIAYSVVTYLRL